MNVFARGRFNPLGAERVQEFERCLGAVARWFGANWLQTDGGNPLQTIWQRSDALASGELILFGDALDRLGQAAPKWVEAKVRDIRSKNVNGRRGFVAEVLIGGLMSAPGADAAPAREGQPAYDFTIGDADAAKTYVAVKNFGMSDAEKKFRLNAAHFERAWRSHIERNGPNGCALLAIASEYPGQDDWASLLSCARRHVLALHFYTGHVERSGIWTVSAHDTGSGGLYDGPDHRSYQVVVTCPFHRNEERNLLGRVSDACDKFARIAAAIGEAPKMVFVQMPQTSDVSRYADALRAEMHEGRLGAVDLIALYRLSATDEHRLQHHIAEVKNPASGRLSVSGGTTRGKYNFSTILGAVSDYGGADWLHVGPDEYSLAGRYHYQSGHTYRLVEHDPEHGSSGKLTTPVRGVHEHAVFRSAEGDMVLSGKFAADGLLKFLT